MARTILVLLAVLAPSANHAWGVAIDPLLYVFETDVKYVRGSSGVVDPAKERFWLGFGIYSGGLPVTADRELASIFSNLLSTSDVGKTLIASPGTPGFDEFAALLTDGQDQLLRLPIAPPGGSSLRKESEWLHPMDAGIDLHGFVIDRITYTLKGWYFDTPGRDPNHNGLWTDEYFGYRISIEGHAIPEPFTFSLMIIVGSCLVALRKPRSTRGGQ